MRKLFLLIPALVLAMVVNADVINITPTSPHSSNNLRQAIDAAASGDIIEMAAGTYVETGDWLAFTDKEITVRAAENAEVIIKPQYSVRVKAPNAPAKAEFIGVKFDCSALESSELFVPADNKVDQKVILDKCELYNWSVNSALIHSTSERRLDVISINDCYFHGFEKNIVFVENANLVSLSITNSTFANVSASITDNYWAAPIDVRATTGTMLVDHCTFYDVKAMSSSYGVIMVNAISDVTVSNSIFAQASSKDVLAIKLNNGGTVQNCLTYNYTKNTNGIQGATTTTDCIVGNPYFINTNADNYDFTPASFSPARNVGTDGENLGDYARWTSNDSAHPKTMNISAGTGAIKAAVEAAWSGDTIVLADGTYSEAEVIEFNKSLVIKAAAEANPVIAQHYYSKVTSGADVKFIGIKFDGSIYPANDHCFYPFDNTAGNELHFEKCEFVGFSSYVLYNGGAYSLDSLIVNNCFFHNNNKSSVIYFEKHNSEGSQTVKGVKVTNSTFANNNTTPSYSVIFVRNQTGTTVSDVEVTVDHCTFYNNTTTNTDHSAIRSYKSTKVNISNCIFAHPELVNLPATSCYGGAISNCLSYNFKYYKSTNGHRQDGGQPVLTDNISGNPVFADPEHNDFTLRNASSARRQNGDVYGDPRWIKDIQSIAIPDTLLPIDAILSDSASVLPGTPDSITYKFVGSNKYNGLEWAKWKVAVDKDGLYNFRANTYRFGSSQKYEIALLNNDETSTLISNDNGESSIGSGNASISTGAIALKAGNTYTVKVRNIYEYADGVLLNVIASYEGGDTITVPANELIGEEAVLVDEGHLKVSKLENGDLKYGDNGNQLDEYVYWNINATKYGRMNVTANVVVPSVGDPSGHRFLVELYSNLSESPLASSEETADSYGTGAIALPALNIPAAGKYIVKLTNKKQYSSAILHSIELAYAGGEAADVPGQIVAADAMLLKEDGGTLKMYLDENGDIKYNDNGNNLTEYAQWNINATEAGEMIVTLNVTNSGHLFTVELYDGETLKSSVAEPDANEWHSGNLELENHLTIPAAGSYTIKLINRQQYSGGAIHGITFAKYIAPAGITMSEEDPDNSAWVDKVDGAAVNVTLTRTILAGMYNTLCLPFPVSSTQCKAVFGDDVELLTFNEATLEDGVLTLSFNTANDIWQGTPVLIKTSSDIVNPTFNGVQIKRATPSSTGGTDADFIGTFFPTVLEANKDLFVGQNNTVHFPSTNNPLKGLRAYFHVKSTAAVVKRARIVTPNNMPTEIELVGAENQTLKTIENGQLIILFNGQMYNVMGVKLQ